MLISPVMTRRNRNTDESMTTTEVISLLAGQRIKKRGEAGPYDEHGQLIIDSYGRLSRNPDGEIEGRERQLGDNDRTLDRNGWGLGLALFDDSFSAWKLTVIRPDWERLLWRLYHGKTGGATVYHTDRLMRQPLDLEALFLLADYRDIQLAASFGRYDLMDSQQRFNLRIAVGHACLSSDDTSRRTKRRNQAMREKGAIRTGGGRYFGWPGPDHLAKPHALTGKKPPVAAALVKRERSAIRDAIKRIVAGVPANQIMTEWNTGGLKTSRGNDWTLRTFMQMIVKPRNAGRIVHEGELVGKVDDSIVSEELFDNLLRLMEGRRKGSLPGRGTHLGSGIIDCGNCGRKLTGTLQAGRTCVWEGKTYPSSKYRCEGAYGCHRVDILAPPVDLQLREWVIARLSDPAHAHTVSTAISRSNARLAEISDELEFIEQRLAEVAAMFSDRTRRMSLNELASYRDPLIADKTMLETERDKLILDLPASDEATAALTQQAVADDWDGSTIEGRRKMLQSALRGHRVVIAPNTPRKGRPRGVDMSRLTIEPITV